MPKAQQTDPRIAAVSDRVVCAQCTAKSRQTGQQCGRPVFKSSRTHKCDWHGALSTGPRTLEGKARSIAARTTHGQATNAVRREQSRASLRLAQIEDVMHTLGLTTVPRSRGRKPSGYWPITTPAQAMRFLFDNGSKTSVGHAQLALQF